MLKGCLGFQLFALAMCWATEPPKTAPTAPAGGDPKVLHRLSWDQWFISGGTDPDKYEHGANHVNVLWDNEKIGSNFDAIAHLAKLEPGPSWTVTFDMPESPGAEARRVPPTSGAFLESCRFLYDWHWSGAQLKFERSGKPVTAHFLRVSGAVESSTDSSWDNPSWFLDGKEYKGATAAIGAMKDISWRKGDMLFLMFPPYPRFEIARRPKPDDRIESWFRELEKVHKVDVIGVNNNWLFWHPLGFKPK